MRNAVGFPEPGGHEHREVRSERQLLRKPTAEYKKRSTLLLWKKDEAVAKRAGPQQICDVNLYEEAQFAIFALRRAQNTRSELWRLDPTVSLRRMAPQVINAPYTRRCGVTRLRNSRDVMIFVFFQNRGKCRVFPVTK
jgi:hypothetical protein